MRRRRNSPITTSNVLWFVITVGVALTVTIWLAAINGLLPSGSSYTVNGILPTAASLAPGSRVTMAGVPVGNVGSVKRVGLAAEVTLNITDSQVTPIPSDSRITLRMRTPLSENYVEITPGTAHTSLRSGATLPASQTSPYVDVDQILSTLQGSARTHARELIQSIGGALNGRGDELNALLGGAAGVVTNGSRVMEILAADRASASRLVQELGNVAASVGERDASIMQIGQKGLVALRAVAGRDQALRSMLAALPSTLAQVRITTNTLGAVSQTATPVVQDLSAAVHVLQPAVVDLRPASAVGRTVLSDLSAASPGLTTTLKDAIALSGPEPQALPEVTKTLCQLNPVIRYAQPYTPDFIQTIVGLGSASNAYDALSHTLRLSPTIDDASLVGLPPAITKDAYTLLHTGLLGGTVGSMTWDPYPPPGQVGKSTSIGVRDITGPSQVPSTGYVYPHILADC